jgi:hypothetical protein
MSDLVPTNPAGALSIDPSERPPLVRTKYQADIAADYANNRQRKTPRSSPVVKPLLAAGSKESADILRFWNTGQL